MSHLEDRAMPDNELSEEPDRHYRFLNDQDLQTKLNQINKLIKKTEAQVKLYEKLRITLIIAESRLRNDDA